ncbi:MAG: DUF6440 family protein [Planctomycetes bacterium]|nr:DUF6440 family protein [Planctomycetota bacterium]
MTDVLLSLVAVILLAILLTNVFRDGIFARNETDSPTRRSDLTIFSDYGTGYQYLGVPLSGLTPRLDKDGKPMRVEPEKKQEIESHQQGTAN